VTAQPFLRLTGVSKTFGGFRALDAIDWDIAPGEVHCLVGENGCGKSTMIKTIAGVHPPDPGGSIQVEGREVLPLDPNAARALGIQVIFQDLSLFPNLTVAENIAMQENLDGLARPVHWRRMKTTAEATLKRLHFTLPLGALVSSLSIAERQIVAICRGLAAQARLLFMDEPTASLTRAEVERLLDIVRRLSAQNIAVVFVSHRLEEVVEIAQRVTVMRDGRMVGTYPAGALDQRAIAKLMTGIDLEQRMAARDMSAAPPLLEVSSLSRAGEYDDISFTLRKGEVLGITGLLGAGRTELALSLFGMTRPDRGGIRLNGNVVRLHSNQDATRAGIAYVSEDRLNLGINARQSIADNTNLAILPRLSNRLGLISPSRRHAAAQHWVDELSIKIGSLDHPISTLSGGNQQRVVLARWLATSPKVLILDSPTVGVDIKNKIGIYDVIRALSERGVGVIVISDEVMEIFATCDRVLHMRSGRLVGSYLPGDISEHALEEKIYA
jgi:simple sugar transport system ATP-binding protein